ncbi:MAG: radical SAM protein [Candidatus Lokiarchaeota archaeon]|nr:radical SAM protein [Candidatus Lokiarchaeota archaeon]
MHIRSTISICPVCLKCIDAEIYWNEEKNEILMRKKCVSHGVFEDRLGTNPDDYLWYTGFSEKIGSRSNMSIRPSNQLRRNEKGCPYSCGLCEKHLSTPCIALVDLTNRCNLHCPVCFANSAVKGYVYEPTFEEIIQIFHHFRNIRPIRPPMLQLSGGEPTLRDDLFNIIRAGKEIGFEHIMLTTNGIKLAQSVEYCRALKKCGLDAIYLSFDGTEPNTYIKMRGVDLSKLKIQILENCRAAKMDAIVLVPTIVNGVNDHEVGNILEIVKQYCDVVSTVVFQPVSLTGRITMEDLHHLRYTTSDLKKELSKVTNGQIQKFYPLAMTAKLTQLMPWFDNAEKFVLLSHDDCGFATIAVLNDSNHWESLESFIDVENLIKYTNAVYDIAIQGDLPHPFRLFKLNFSDLPRFLKHFLKILIKKSDYIYRHVLKLYYLVGAVKYYHGGIKFMMRNKNLVLSTLRLLVKPGLQSMKKFMLHRNIMIGSMHFQDPYNFDLERVQRCVVHYGVIDPEDPTRVKEIPFCAMNTIHRDPLEKKLANREETVTEEQLDKYLHEILLKLPPS